MIHFLVDSSAVWRLQRHRDLAEIWTDSLISGAIGSCEPQRAEFRRSARNAAELDQMNDMFRVVYPDVPVAKSVWRWVDWPGRAGKADTGIDLVARERDTGDYTAIQCKFYEPTHTLAKGDIDSFFTASGKTAFTNRVIISTTDRWSHHAETALANQ